MTPSYLRITAVVVAAAVTVFAVAYFAYAVTKIIASVKTGKPAPDRLHPVGARLGQLFTSVLTHREFKGRPLVKVAHWLVMLSFPILFFTLVSGYGQLSNPAFSLPLLGHFLPWEWLVETFAFGGLAGIIALVIVRWRTGNTIMVRGVEGERSGTPAARVSRFFGSTRWQAWFVEAVIVIVVLCVIGLRGAEYALESGPASAHSSSAWHYPLSWPLGRFLAAHADPQALSVLVLTLAFLKIITSMVWLAVIAHYTAMGVAWHRFLAVVNIYARRETDGAKALGAAAPLVVDGQALNSSESFDELEQDAVLGTGTAADLTWKQRLDFASCTECGRCQELCPAWNTGKPLSPKLLTLSLRDHVSAVDRHRDGDAAASVGGAHSADVLGALRESGNTDANGVATALTDLVGPVVNPEALWDCTTCGACVDQCPVDIEHVDHILNLRRYQVLMESAFPRELARPMRSLESKANPYNQSPRKRLDWAKNLDFEVPVIGEDVEDATEVDWLFWVGCAGAFDDRAKRTSAAIATLLHLAGVNYAVLGSAESCTGDPARRAGNEVLFQMLAEQAIDTLTEAKVRRIVVSCAHCFNTIANEFPQLGATFEVVHHTQLLNRLVREGRLRPVPPAAGEGQRLTYHDPCYLGRHNQVYSPSRELLGATAGSAVVEMPRSGERAFCCGAGGARAWMEETQGVRIAAARTEEAAATGAEVIATACPFCSQMLGSAAPSSSNSELEVKDVAVVLLESVLRGRPDAEGGNEDATASGPEA